MKERTLEKIRAVVIMTNIIVASIALANLASLSTRAIEITVPEDGAEIWSLDVANQQILVQTEFNVKNNALYDIRDINLEADLYLDNETRLISYSQEDLIIPRFSNQSLPIMVTIGLEELPFEDLMPLIVLDADFSLHVKVSASYLWSLGEFEMDQTFYFPWESPMKLAMVDYIENAGAGGLVSLVEEAITKDDMTVFYEALNAANLNAVFELFGIEISLLDLTIVEEVIGFTIGMAYGDSTIEAEVKIPFNDYGASTIKLKEGLLDG